jgi:hypothetical protein
LTVHTGLLAVLALALGLAGCASSGPSPGSLQAASSEGGAAPRARTATVKKRAPAVARRVPAEEPYAPAEVPTGTVGLSPVEAASANATATNEAARREDERIRRIMTICANCGM